MKLCIVPMKPLATAKERLAPALDPDARRTLSLAMLADVVEAARGLGAVWVLHSDPEAAQIAAGAGAEARPDPAPGAGLNPSLEAATTAAIEAGFSGVLVLSADVPLVTAEDALAVAAGEGVALAPSLDGGTNALWRAPPRAIPAAFGGRSRDVHEALALARGVPFRCVEREHLALDVDSPADLDALAATSGGARHTRAALARMFRR